MTNESTSPEVRLAVARARDACRRPEMVCGVPEPTFECVWSFIEGLRFSAPSGTFITVFGVWLHEHYEAPLGRVYSYLRDRFRDDKQACAELDRLLGECFGGDTDPWA